MRENAMVHFRPHERPLLKRLQDLASRVERTGRMALTEFLTPREARAALMAAKDSDVTFFSFGGYTQAERVRGLYCAAGEMPLADDYGVVCLHAAFWPGDGLPRHGDVLGSLIGLGTARDRIGDIAIQESDVYVFCTETVAPFLLAQWTKAGRATIAPRQMDLAQLPTFSPPVTQEKVCTLQSLRLDAFVAHAFGMSRTKAVVPIETGKVSLNFVPCTDPAADIAVDDIVSLRGSGRARVLSVEGESRSGRTFIRIGRYV